MNAIDFEAQAGLVGVGLYSGASEVSSPTVKGNDFYMHP